MGTRRSNDLLVRVQVDKVAASLAKRMVADLRQEMTLLEQEAVKLTRNAAPASMALNRLDDRAIKRITRSGREATETLEDMRRAALEDAKAIEKVAQAADFRTQLRGLREENRIESMARSSLQSLTFASGLGSTGPVRVLSQFYEFMDAIPEASATIGELTKRMLETGPVTTKAVDALQQYVPGMSAAAAKTTVMVGSLGAMAAAAVGLGIAVGVAKNIIEDSAKVTKDFIGVNQRYAEVIATGTTEQVREAIKENEDRNKALEIERQMLQKLVDEAENTEGFAGALLDVNDALNLNLGGMEDAKNRLEEVNTEIGTNIDLNAWLTRSLNEGATAAADYAARQEKVNEMLAAASASQVQAIQAAEALRVSTRQRVQTEDDPERVLNEIEALHATYQESTRTVRELSDAYNQHLITKADYRAAVKDEMAQQNDLLAQIQALTNEVLPAAEANKAAADAEKAREEAIKAATKTLEDDAAKLRDIAADRAALEAANAEDLKDITYKRDLALSRDAEDYARKTAKDQAKLYDDLADLERDYLDERADLLRDITDIEADYRASHDEALKDFNQDDLRRTEAHYRKLADIEKNMRKRIQDAAASLDALGVIEAREQGKEQLEDEKEQYAIEQKYRKDDLKDLLENLDEERQEKLQAAQEALRDLEQQHQAERQKALDAYRQAQADAAAEQALRRARQQEDWAYEDSQRASHFQKQLSDLNTAQTAIESANATHFIKVHDITQAGLNSVASSFTAFFNGFKAPPASNPGSGGPTLPTYAEGGDASGWGWVGERGPEPVFFAGKGRVFPSDFSLQKSLAPQINAPVSLQIHLGGGDQTPFKTLQDQTRFEQQVRAMWERFTLELFQEARR
jgi:hypothetical protein